MSTSITTSEEALFERVAEIIEASRAQVSRSINTTTGSSVARSSRSSKKEESEPSTARGSSNASPNASRNGTARGSAIPPSSG